MPCGIRSVADWRQTCRSSNDTSFLWKEKQLQNAVMFRNNISIGGQIARHHCFPPCFPLYRSHLRRREKKRRIRLRFSQSGQSADFVCTLNSRKGGNQTAVIRLICCVYFRVRESCPQTLRQALCCESRQCMFYRGYTFLSPERRHERYLRQVPQKAHR